LVTRTLLILYIILSLESARPLPNLPSRYKGPWPIRERARILEALNEKEGTHLVLVRYAPDHNPHQEWVYNEADIDGSKVVWAREMDGARNCEIVKYFKDRRIWLLEADAPTPILTPYPVPLSHPEKALRKNESRGNQCSQEVRTS
jgi:hypothetical protein